MNDEQSPGVRRIFVLGGVRSGKSSRAAEMATTLAGEAPVLFIATAEPSSSDSGMHDRISRHRQDRPDHWRTVEEPLDPSRAIVADSPEPVAIVDCLTIWISNLLARCGDPETEGFAAAAEDEVAPALQRLCKAISSTRKHVVLVANDVGSGVAPPTRLGNVFADMQGTVNQRVAAACDEVYHTVAGIPVRIK